MGLAYSDAGDCDPMARVLGMDAGTSGVGAWFGFASGSTMLLAGILTAASMVAWLHVRHQAVVEARQELEIAREEAPRPPGSVAPGEERREPRSVRSAAPARATPAASPPAHVAKVLTATPRSDEPVDLTGDAIVQRPSHSNTGAFTTAPGTGTTAPSNPPGGGHEPGGSRAVVGSPQVQAQDRSRSASLAGAADWSCPFPPEADTAQIDEAYVTLQVDAGPEGAPLAARVLTDPGNGFGREARRCAMGRLYTAALDRDGDPIAGTTRPFRVHFSR
jgi:protein TonB